MRLGARPLRGRPLRTLLAAALLGGLAAATEPSVRDTAGLIAFVNEFGRVAVVDPASLEVTVFGDGPRRAIFPAWSSDGSKVAAVVAVPGGSQVEVVDVSRDDGPSVVLSSTDRSPIYLNWSPDDAYLAVLSGTPGTQLALDIVDMELVARGEAETRTTLELGQPFYWVWTPSGRSVLVHRDVLRDTALVGLSPIDEFAVDAPLPSPGAFQSPDISDSGLWVAYARRDLSGGRVVVVGNPERRESAAPVAELVSDGLVAFAWRPGHDHLSVQGAGTPGYFIGPVVLIEVPGGAVRVVSPDIVVGSFWSPDGRWLATLSVLEDDDDGRVADAGDGLRRVQAPVPLLSVRFVDVDTGEVVEAGAYPLSRTFLTQYLPFFDQYSRSHSIWSPDSTALVLPVVGSDGLPTLTVMGVDGSSTQLLHGDMPAWNVR